MFNYCMNKIKLYNFIIILSVVLCFFNEILNGIIQKNYLDKVSFFMLLVTGMFNLSIKKRLKIKYPFYFLAFLFLSFIYFVFSYNTLLSFVYEYAKIFNFLLFIPILRDYNNKDIICLTNKVLRVISIFLFINLIIIVLQFLFGNSIIRVLGYSDLRINGSEYNGRLTGFIHLGTLGPISLLFMILNKASFAISVVGRTGNFFGADSLLLLYFPEIILINLMLNGEAIRQIG